MRIRLLTISLITSLAFAQAHPGDRTLSGKLVAVKPATEGAPPRYEIGVGPTRYSLELPPEAAGTLVGKYVSVKVRVWRGSNVSFPLRHVETKSLAVQQRQIVLGRVAERRSKRNGRPHHQYVLLVKDTEYVVAKEDARRFKKHLGAYVAAEAFTVSDGKFRQVAAVKAVKPAVPPGARQPKKGDEALVGKWSGTMKALKVPSGVPGANAGDEFAVFFTSTEKLRATKGRLFATYDVIGVRARKFARKKRRVRFDLDYSFGSGSSSVRFDGEFRDDFKQLTGTWSSSFLGSGTFVLDWAEK